MVVSSNIAAVSLLLFSLLLLHFTQAEQLMRFDGSPSPSPLAQPIDCRVACEGRCRLTKRQNLCKRSCGRSCCARCQCVPPGTATNHQACPCYANLTNTLQCSQVSMIPSQRVSLSFSLLISHLLVIILS